MPGRVTVGVPVYRGEAFLAESLKSVLDQTYQNFDVLISVDGSESEKKQI